MSSEKIMNSIKSDLDNKIVSVGREVIQNLEKTLMLQILDSHWKEHLGNMDYLRQGIHLRGYAQKNPTQEYKREAFVLFSEMLTSITRQTIEILSRIKVDQDLLVADSVTKEADKPIKKYKSLSKNRKKEQRKKRR